MGEALIGVGVALLAIKTMKNKDFRIVKILEKITILIMILFNVSVIVKFYLSDLFLMDIINFDYKEYSHD